MIEVKDLHKRYGFFEALRFVSFAIEKGEAVGLLGANGAGKTTTMRILSCFLPPTSGSVRVAGKDVVFESEEVRRQIGYLPESVPLYGGMRVEEFLRFRAKLKGVRGKNVKEAVARSLDRVQLTDRRRTLVQNLSKGLRQRVGFADALVHDPEVLILDEPTSGLDPSQRAEVKKLLASLRGRHTILISSHILPEVETLCERVVVLKSGSVVAETSIAALVQGDGTDHFTITVRGTPETLAAKMPDLLRSVSDRAAFLGEESGDGTVRWRFETKFADGRAAVVRALALGGLEIHEVKSTGGGLESAYLTLLKRSEPAA